VQAGDAGGVGKQETPGKRDAVLDQREAPMSRLSASGS
jgi:hypothetical protein